MVVPVVGKKSLEEATLCSLTPRAKHPGMIWRLCASLWTFGLMVIAFYTAFTLQVSALLTVGWLLPSRTRKLFLGFIFRAVSSIAIRWNPAWSLKVLGHKPIKQPGRVILMANHLSNSDAFFLSAAMLPWETKYVAKASLFWVPFGGWAMRLAGDLPVHFIRSKENGWGVRKGTVGKMMVRCRRYLEQEIPLAVFPEGGRSENGRLRPLKDGFFKLAIQTHASILPCAISGTELAWPPHEKLVSRGNVYVRFGEPVPSKGHDAHSLKEAVRQAIIALKRDLPPPVVAGQDVFEEGEEQSNEGGAEGEQEGGEGEEVLEEQVEKVE